MTENIAKGGEIKERIDREKTLKIFLNMDWNTPKKTDGP